MIKMLRTGIVTAGLLALAPMIPALGFQSIETFRQARIVVPYGGTTATAALQFCTIRGYSGTTSYDLKNFIQPTEGTAGMAVFNRISCKTYAPATTFGG